MFKHREVITDHYTTGNVIRTIEEVPKLEYLNIHTATFRPMAVKLQQTYESDMKNTRSGRELYCH